MSTVPYDTPEEAWQDYEAEEPLGVPRRPRRQFLTRTSALLLAVIVGGACFYAGVRVEKGQLSGGVSGLRATASRLGGASSLLSRSGAGGASSFLAGRFGGGTFGTVSSVNGRTLVVTETGTGNAVKVKLSSATAVTKSEKVGSASIRPGDSVTVEGVKAKNGTVAATSVSDSGNRSTGTATSSGSSSSGSASAISSLFSGGGK